MSSPLPVKRRDERCRPGVEGLDRRLVLSAVAWSPASLTASATPITSARGTTQAELGPWLGVTATSPEAGSTTRGPVSSFSVTFDRPLDRFSIAYYEDVRLDRLDGGDWVRAYDEFSPPTVELDDTETRLSFALWSPLGPGEYRMVLPAWSFLSGADGATPADPFEDQVLGGFRVESPGIGLDDAGDLGTITDSPTLIVGALDLDADPRQVRLYRFVLPEGHRWRIGAEISAQREGSALRTALALFDSEGRLLRVSNQGRPDAPGDPYLFHGLGPGTYYIGISQARNVPGTPGGYDPAAASPGSASQPGEGGGFRLQIVADPADEPTKVVGLSATWADPTRAAPTGLTLTFSGPLDPGRLLERARTAVEAVGEDGRAWPLTAVAMNEAGAQYYFLFRETLPAGRYLIRLAGDGEGLVDLSGLAPSARGEAPGVLGRIKIEESRPRAADPNDLGPLFEEVHEGKASRDVILPGTAVTYRFVAVSEGLYRVDAPAAAGTVLLNILGPTGLTSRQVTPDGPALVYLPSGVYLLQFVNQGTAPIDLSWELRLNSLWDSLLENGIGQGPALGLRLVSPTAPTGGSTPPTTSLGPTVAATPAPSPGDAGPVGPFGAIVPQPGPQGSGVSWSNSPGGTAGLLLSFAGTPVGFPSPGADHVPAVGPEALALAFNGPGLPPGVGQSLLEPSTTPEWSDSDPPVDRRPPIEPDAEPAPPEAVADGEGTPREAGPGEGVVASDGSLIADAEDGRTGGDERALAAAAWLDDFGTIAGRLLARLGRPVSDGPVEADDAAAPIALTRDDQFRPSAGRVEKADFSTPLVVGVASWMVVRHAHPVRNWWRRRKAGPVATTRASSGSPLRGPHRLR